MDLVTTLLEKDISDENRIVVKIVDIESSTVFYAEILEPYLIRNEKDLIEDMDYAEIIVSWDPSENETNIESIAETIIGDENSKLLEKTTEAILDFLTENLIDFCIQRLNDLNC